MTDKPHRKKRREKDPQHDRKHHELRFRAQSLLYLSLGIFLFLVVSSLFSWFGPFGPKLKGELKSRIKTWWIIIVIVIGILSLPKVVSILFFAALSAIALREYLNLIPVRGTDSRAVLWAYLSIPMQFGLVLAAWYGMFIIFIPVFMFLILAVRLIIIGETKGFLAAVSALHWGLMINVFSLSHVAYLSQLNLVEAEPMKRAV